MKTTTRYSQLWKCLSAAVLLVASSALAARPAQAQVVDVKASSIVGSWKAVVNVANPPGLPSFPVVMTIHGDGTMVGMRLPFIPILAGGTVETTEHGAWRQVDDNKVVVTFIDLIQGAPGNTNLNGAFLATETITFHIVLGADGNTFTAQWSGTIVDPNGVPLLPPGNGTISAVRIQVES